jgi:hypothetical protein
MATDRQLAANRANALKSTGPRTPAGKTASATNALKSGIYAKSLLIPGEDPAEYDALRQEQYDHFDPANPDERDLLDLLIRQKWQLRRLQDCYDQLWFGAVNRDLQSEYHDPDTPLTRPFNLNEENFSKLSRMIHAADRAMHRARTALIRTQEKRLRTQPPPPPPAELASFPPKAVTDPELPPPPHENGFVPSKTTSHPIESPNSGDKNRSA